MNKALRSFFALLVLTAVLVCAAVLSGCESEPPDINAEDLIGRWTRLVSGGTETIQFTRDMKFTVTCTVNGETTVTKGNYDVSGNKLYMAAKKSDSVEHTVRFRKSNIMVWEEFKIPIEFIKE